MISPCATIREALALEPMNEDPLVQAHLNDCATCARYRRQHQSLDVVLRAEMSWEAPAALTARLLAIAADPVAAIEKASAPVMPRQPAQAVPTRPKTWFVSVVYALTLMIIAISLLVAWQVVGALLAQVEPGAILTQLLALPQQGLTYLITKLPQSRYLVDFLLRVRVQLMWLLLVAVLWAVLDQANLKFSFRGRQITL